MELFLQQVTNSAVLAAAYVLVALGLFLIFSVLHIPNFAHGEMFALGAYLQYLFVVQTGVPFFPALPLTMAGVGLVGYVLERFVFRRLQSVDLIAVLIASLALSIILQELIALAWGTSPLSVPAPIGGISQFGSVRIGNYRLLIVVLVLLTAALLAWVVYGSGFGRKLRGLAQNREVAQLSGIDVRKVGAATFVLGSVLAGIAGGLLSAASPLIPSMGFHPVLVSFVILVVVGGGGRLTSALLGGFAVAVIETLTAGYIANGLRHVVVFVVLVLFLVWRPEGAVRQGSAERAQL